MKPKITIKKINQPFSPCHFKPSARGLSTSLIKRNKHESETFSIQLAQRIAKEYLGIPKADISVSRVKYLNHNFREYSYRKLVLVREKTYTKGSRQFEERELYPFLDKRILFRPQNKT